MKMKMIVLGLLILSLLLAGCTQPKPTDTTDTTPPVTGTTPPANGGDVDLCAGVNCPDKCDGTSRLSDGYCVSGECVYTSVTENSTACGFTAVPTEFEGMDFDVSFYYCEFDPNNNAMVLFFPIKNAGSVSTQKGYIEFVAEDLPTRKYEILNKTYLPGRWVWDDKTFTRNYEQQKGFEVSFTAPQKDFDYQVIYCVLGPDAQPGIYPPCTEDTGLVLIEGNTNEKC